MQREGCRYRIGQSEEALKKGQAVLGDIELYLVGHAVDAGFMSNLTAIGRMFDTLREKEARRLKATADLKATAAVR